MNSVKFVRLNCVDVSPLLSCVALYLLFFSPWHYLEAFPPEFLAPTLMLTF